MRRIFADYGLSITLAALWLVSWVIQTGSGWVEFAAEQANHGDQAEVFGSDGYIWVWLRTTFENAQSEFLQLLTFVVLTTYLVHKGSHESKDTDDKMQAQLNRIEQRLERLEQSQADRANGATGHDDARRGQHAASRS